MKKITDYKNEDAIELLADLIEPATEIMADQTLRNAIGNVSRIKIAQIALKNHKSAVLEILARLDEKTPETFSCNPVTILAGMVSLMNDPELVDFFVSQAKEEESESSLSLVENTKAKEK